MEEYIRISWLNDFLFCPVSIYFHGLYGDADRTLIQSSVQLNGTNAHRAIDEGSYSTRKDVLTGVDVFSEEIGIIGKIDMFYVTEGLLVERKKHISVLRPGYVMQIYAQCMCLREMGYEVRKLQLRSLDDNKAYSISLPEDSKENAELFANTVQAIRRFSIDGYVPDNAAKCKNCIYEPACDRSVADAK